MSAMTTSSASVKAVAKSSMRSAVREYMCGSKTAHRRRSAADLLARGTERRPNLGRVVPVVVVDRHRRSIGDQLHAAPGSGERAEPVAKQVEVGPEGSGHEQCGRGVQHVVLAGERHLPAASEEAEARAGAVAYDVGRLGLATGAVADDASLPALEAVDEARRPGVVGRDEQEAPVEGRVRPHAAHEPLERIRSPPRSSAKKSGWSISTFVTMAPAGW